ncbi:hypothetical protein OF83DRAFT_937122 [Amylostereum chailletii]|nr:hypothetical protein OF83DRAFT_937122 [Amylostereum chailletii]
MLILTILSSPTPLISLALAWLLLLSPNMFFFVGQFLPAVKGSHHPKQNTSQRERTPKSSPSTPQHLSRRRRRRGYQGLGTRPRSSIPSPSDLNIKCCTILSNSSAAVTYGRPEYRASWRRPVLTSIWATFPRRVQSVIWHAYSYLALVKDTGLSVCRFSHEEPPTQKQYPNSGREGHGALVEFSISLNTGHSRLWGLQLRLWQHIRIFGGGIFDGADVQENAARQATGTYSATHLVLAALDRQGHLRKARPRHPRNPSTKRAQG